MNRVHDLSELLWTVEGYTPYLWLFERVNGIGFGAQSRCVDVPPVPARVPGSVQGALRTAGILPDWNVGLGYRACEWVEHRHWMYRTFIPDSWMEEGRQLILECQGLDYSGWVHVNGREAGSFTGTHVPHAFDVTSFCGKTGNVLEIVFDLPPRWLGQFGYTSRMWEWKTRFNYTWDWVPRLVQVGIWDAISLVSTDGCRLGGLSCTADADLSDGTGILDVRGAIAAGCGSRAHTVHVALERDGLVIREGTASAAEWQRGILWTGLPVKLWWPNLQGDQPLYTLTCRLLDAAGAEQDRLTRRVGFRHVAWQPCENAPAGADPWLCVVNGRRVFLQGVNFAPLSGLFADTRREDYERRLRQYRDMGLNLFRINACQFLERQFFYDLCDEMGLMVWQEFPLTSSGLDNWPPEDPESIEAMAEIATSFITRRRHHASLILWAGGNELMGDLQGRKTGMGRPCDESHPMLKRLGEVARRLDPGRRYIATSPLGPRASADPKEFGQGLHWDVHGGAAMGTLEDAEKYWAADDALFRSEVYCSGSSPAVLIRAYAGGMEVWPPTEDNPYWSRLTTWWLDWRKLTVLHGREPRDLEEYVAWSQDRQAVMLAREVKAARDRFPRCGGVLMWSGHDTFPLAINSSLIDYDGNPKPAATEVSRMWRAR